MTQCIDWLLDLGCEVKLEAKKESPVYKDPVDWLKHDLEVSVDGLAWLKEITEAAREDYTTFDILKGYYQDEEEDVLGAGTAGYDRVHRGSELAAAAGVNRSKGRKDERTGLDGYFTAFLGY